MSSSDLSPAQGLLANELHLWMTDCAAPRDDEQLAELLTVLSADEVHRMERFRFARDRHRYLLTRALLRHTLSLYQPEIRADRWQFVANSHGKPAIANGGITLPFNLSHSGRWIVLAVHASLAVGVDIEQLSGRESLLDIAESHFAPGETDLLRKTPGAQQPDRFLDIWTLKEAYIKACGLGLAIPLDSFSFDFKHDSEIGLALHKGRDDQASLWTFQQYRIDEGYRLAVATRGSRESERPAQIRFCTAVNVLHDVPAGLTPLRQSPPQGGVIARRI